jgi:putative ABC transport system permease protein
MMQTLWQDLRYGARVLMKRPGFTLIAVITLSLGIGANTAIFSVVEAIFLRPVPFRDAERLVYLTSSFPGNTHGGDNFSYPDFQDLQSQQASFEAVAAYQDWIAVAMTGGQEPVRVIANFTSESYFELLGARAQLGRLFTPEENRVPGGEQVVVLSHAFWRRQFGAAVDIVGRQVRLNDMQFTVTGVMSEDFRDFEETWRPTVDVWAPIAISDRLLRQTALTNRNNRLFNGVAKLRPGVTLAQGQAELNRIAERLAAAYPETDRGYGLHIRTLRDHFVGTLYNPVLLLLVGSGFVLLIGCVNVANLSLVSQASRRGEFAVRAALGASRRRLARQLLAESFLLATAGGVLGLLLSLWATKWLGRWDAIELPSFIRLELNRRVMGVSALLSLLTTFLFGMAPALESARVNLRDAVNQAGRGDLGRNMSRKILIVTEVSLALLLLVGAGLALKSFQKLTSTGIGYRTENLLTMRMDLRSDRYARPEARVQFAKSLVEKTGALAGVESATIWGPGNLENATWVIFATAEGRPAQRQEDWMMTHRHNVNPGGLGNLGIGLVRGRDFTWQDGANAPGVAIISESVARGLWPGEDPVGRRFMWQARNAYVTVIGVAADARHRQRFHSQFGAQAFGPQRDIYLPYAQAPSPAVLLAVRTKSDPAGVVASLRSAVLSLDPDLPVYDLKSLTERLRAQEAPNRAVATLAGIYASLALLLAGLGIYGVLAYTVSQRTREIAIRMAMGAQRRDILSLALSQGMGLTLAGVAIGLAAAFGLTRLMKGLLFGVSATDPLVFTGVTLSLVTIATLACWLPARRAAKVDPMIALRCN